ncbi:MAG: DUF2914 domain-containing protein [Gemmatimonadetes bacterium]|nr:DUF2914 domain-containing protein [Gemmatimonadota bacterium]
MRTRWLAMTAVTLSCVAAGRGLAQEQAGPVVMEAAVGTAVVDRELQGAAEMFPATVGTLYCFSRIGQTQAGTTIEHVWYFGDQEVARVELSIGGSPWRTWSSKTIPAEATGSWRVDIVANGNLLKSLSFTVQ